jgi:RimJ/RimL family protein N-acetyltransferase
MSIDLGKLTMRGIEVSLRPMEAGDAEAFAEAAAESREQYAYTPVPRGLSEATEYIERAFRQRDAGQRYPFTILRHGRVVGSTSYCEYQPWPWPAGCPMQRQDRPDACEIGYTWLAASAQRTRCNTEAKFLLLSHAFEVWNVHRVSLRTDVRNERSRRAIERLGAKLDGVLRADKAGQDGAVRDSAFYSIIAVEWPVVKERLGGFLAMK